MGTTHITPTDNGFNIYQMGFKVATATTEEEAKQKALKLERQEQHIIDRKRIWR